MNRRGFLGTLFGSLFAAPTIAKDSYAKIEKTETLGGTEYLYSASPSPVDHIGKLCEHWDDIYLADGPHIKAIKGKLE